MAVFLMHWHRRLSLLAGVALLLWASSGLLHPLMSWTNPRPAVFAPPVGEPMTLPQRPLAELLDAQGVTEVGLVRLLHQQERLLWQVALPDRQRLDYFDAVTGAPVADADRDRAVLLARHYTGLDDAPLRSVERITAFSRDYPAVNRLLPVWRVVFERGDGLEAWIDTEEDRLASLSDRRKRVLQGLFQTVHTLDFLDGVEGLRLGLIVAAVGSVLAMCMLGIGLLWRIRRRSAWSGVRRWHRSLAWVVWVPILMFSLSGLFHLLRMSPALQPVDPPSGASRLAVHALHPPPVLMDSVRSLSLLPLPDGGAVWRGRRSATQLEIADALDGRPLAGGDPALALRLASASPPALLRLQTAFSGEYGFAYKRLPVWRLETAAGLVFVDVVTGQIAARVGRMDRAEQWSFSALHKWQFLDPLGRAWRDGIMVCGVLLSLLAAVAGLVLRARRRSGPGRGVAAA